jgi:hypothetical protein
MKVYYESRVSFTDGLSGKIDGPFTTKEEARKSAKDYFETESPECGTYVLEIKKGLVSSFRPIKEQV